MMEFTKETSVLYQNRVCDQENFHLINTGLQSIYKVKSCSFTNVDTLVSNSNYIKGTVTSVSSLWIICRQGTKKKSSDSFKLSHRSYDLSNNLVQLPGSRDYYCVYNII